MHGQENWKLSVESYQRLFNKTQHIRLGIE